MYNDMFFVCLTRSTDITVAMWKCSRKYEILVQATGVYDKMGYANKLFVYVIAIVICWLWFGYTNFYHLTGFRG